ncbi:DUF6233 domain-containing protein [Streptomyces sp. NPDC059917]|uniref:DUF6233 domain-containing protein n=1 Tax=Streptomyces sp. NPDC059917 TaxID=3347002 RepID=UPI003648F491
MGEVEARLERWRAVAAWLVWQQRQAEQTIAALEAELAELQARRPPPVPPEWTVEMIRTAGGPRVHRVHVGGCAMGGSGKPADREQVRRMLAEGTAACPYCGPGTLLGSSAEHPGRGRADVGVRSAIPGAALASRAATGAAPRHLEAPTLGEGRGRGYC